MLSAPGGWSLRPPVVVTVAAVLLGMVTASSVRAEDQPTTAGDVVVGELVQGYADPGPHGGHEEAGHAGHADPDLLSWIRTAPGEAVRVSTEDLGDAPTGATVEVTVGEAVADEAAESGLEPALEVLASEVLAEPEQPVAAATTDPVNHPVTVVMVQPADAATQRAADPTTVDSLVGTVDGPVADFWRTQSGGAVRLGVAKSVDWIVSDATCRDPFGLWQDAATASAWAGAPAEHLLVYVPANSPDCAYGLGTVGRSIDEGGLLYVQAAATPVLAHEFGHNLGLGHSSLVQCDRTVEGGTCGATAYADYYDVMGFSWGQVGTLNAPQAAHLGVLVEGEIGRIAPTEGVTEVSLAPVSTTPASGSRRVIDLADVDGGHYWLEYRQASGQDVWLGDSRNRLGLQQGVTLRRSSTGFDTSLLLDGSPSARADWPGDQHVVLPTGTRVAVGQANFVITVLSTDSTTARVQIAVVHPIDLAYERLGGAAVLGQPVTGRVCGLRDGGCFTHYEGGSIYWSKATGARSVRHSTRDRWAALGWETGGLGYPLTDTTCTLRDGGCFQHFQGGSLYATGSQARAYVTQGRARDRWAASGWESGVLGFPTSDTVCGLRNGGCFQHFQSGSVYSSTSTGVRLVGPAVRQRWAGTGWENGRLGYPVTDQVCGLPDSGCFVHFERGSVYVSATTGAQDLLAVVRDRWAASGWERGALGYPVNSTVCGLRDGGCFQHFQRGSVYWSPGTGARLVDLATRGVWAASGWEGGALGYPVGDQVCGLPDSGCFVHFQGGSVYTSAKSGSHAVAGWVRDAWAASGWERSSLGYPVEGRRFLSDGESQRFQGGTLRLYYRTGQVRVV